MRGGALAVVLDTVQRRGDGIRLRVEAADALAAILEDDLTKTKVRAAC